MTRTYQDPIPNFESANYIHIAWQWVRPSLKAEIVCITGSHAEEIQHELGSIWEFMIPTTSSYTIWYRDVYKGKFIAQPNDFKLPGVSTIRECQREVLKDLEQDGLSHWGINNLWMWLPSKGVK